MAAFLRAVFSVVVLLGILAAAGSYVYVLQGLKSAGPLLTEKPVYIKPGSSTNAIAATLAAENVIADPLVFRIGARLQRGNGALQAGEYLFPARISIQGAISLLQSGKTYQRRITIPEGLMVIDIAALVNAAPALTGDIDPLPAEGSILPETYHYTYGETRNALVARMQKAMTDTLAELWETRMDGLPVKTPAEAVVLASVVEKETGIAAERAKVAGVFINRLKSGMKLQSDPTTIYALTEGKRKFDRALLRRDLNIESPYNTYFVTGLPPAPIANPGRASLAAVMMPEQHDYFYFVADGTGGHAFGKTLDDHNRNVAKWRQIRRDR